MWDFTSEHVNILISPTTLLYYVGYLFRNAEYVLALKDLLKIRPRASWDEYKEAFDRMDRDGSGYIELTEIRELFDSVYGNGATPQFEIDAFMEFFDENKDGRISWDEFEKSLGVVSSREQKESTTALLGRSLLVDENNTDDDDDVIDINTDVSGAYHSQKTWTILLS